VVTSSLPIRRSNSWLFVLAGGLVAGTLDILYACIFWALKRGVPAQRILQSVAAACSATPASKAARPPRPSDWRCTS